MPHHSRKKKKPIKTKRSEKPVTDEFVTLAVSADSTKSHKHLPKSVTHPSRLSKVKNYGEIAPHEDYEEEQEDLLIDPTSSDAMVQRNGKDNFNLYPWDFWEQVSRHIEPTQVKTFSLINRQTYALTHTVGFWRNLYDKGYAKKPLNIKLPESLGPDTTYKVKGLK